MYNLGDSVTLFAKYNLYVGKYYVDELPSDAKYILVDHNDRQVPGEIVAVLDHHPTPNDKSGIEYYRNEKVSATACMIAKDCEEELDKHDIEIACVATFIDTVSFHSTKTVKKDISWVNEMTTKYDLDYDEIRSFEKGVLKSYPPSDYVLIDDVHVVFQFFPFPSVTQYIPAKPQTAFFQNSCGSPREYPHGGQAFSRSSPRWSAWSSRHRWGQDHQW